MFYNARWYGSSLGRFAQADTIVLGGVQGYDRYAYTNNNPVRYTDPSGHEPEDCFDRDHCATQPIRTPTPAPKKTTLSVYCGRSYSGMSAPGMACGPGSATTNQMNEWGTNSEVGFTFVIYTISWLQRIIFSIER